MKAAFTLPRPPQKYDYLHMSQSFAILQQQQQQNITTNDPATSTQLGAVKVDGTTITAAVDGTISGPMTYTEGTWAPTDASGAGLTATMTIISAIWARWGNLVFIRCQLTYPATASGANATIGGFPVAMPANGSVCLAAHSTSANGPDAVETAASATTGVLVKNSGVCTNANMSGATLVFSGIYSTV